MNTKTFREKISENWKAKLSCFAIAVLIVFFHSFSNVDKKNLTVSLQVRSDGMMMPASKLGKSSYIKVTVRGEKDDIALITENDLTAYIDISGITQEGTYEFPIVVQPDKKLLLMESLEITPDPDTVSLKVEEKIFKYVPVEATISGEPAHGYEILSSTCEPDSVRIIGPSSIVNSIQHVRTSRVPSEETTSSFETDVQVINDNSFIQLENDKQKIHVSVDIGQKRGEQEFKGVNIYLRNVPEGLDVSNPGVCDVIVEGALLSLENFTSTSIFAYCDCSTLTETGDITVPVMVYIPQSTGVSFVKNSVESVVLKVEEKLPEVTEEQELIN